MLLIPIAGILLLVSSVGTEQAGAHEGFHPFESEIAGIFPPRLATGLEVRMLDFDEQVELVNRSGEPVIVMGYSGEPYARVESDGPVFLNVRSPALHVNNDRWGKTPPSGDADASAPPNWVRVGDGGRLAWFDRRSHYRRPGTPDSIDDPAVRKKMWGYRIPITVGGQAATIRGTLYWAGHSPFPIAIFTFLLIATAGCAILGAWAIKRLRSAGEPESEGGPSTGRPASCEPEPEGDPVAEDDPAADGPMAESRSANQPLPVDHPDPA